MKTFVGKKEAVRPVWYIVDAQGSVLGRVATRIATVLIGKHRPQYTPHVDSGDHVVVVNVAGIRVTGNKFEEKLYRTHSFYSGGMKTRTYRQVVERTPTRPLELAVKRMLPKNRLQAKRIRRLHIYTGGEHKHQAQTLTPLK